jgi:hypothetical protein
MVYSRLVPRGARCCEGEDVKEVHVDSGDDDPWRDVDNCVIVGAELLMERTIETP